MNLRVVILCSLSLFFFGGCSVLNFGAKSLEIVGKTAWYTGKAVVLTVQTTGELAGSGIRFLSGDRTVELEKIGNSYFVEAVLNKKYKARLMLDTGSSTVLITPELAAKMNLKLSKCMGRSAILADGSAVPSQSAILRTVSIGSLEADRVQANIIGSSTLRNYDGLLGMSFLKNFVFTIDTENSVLILNRKKNKKS